jgi:hypothetical protein
LPLSVMRAKTDLRKPIKLFLPVHSLCEKDFPSRLTQIRFLCRLGPPEGRIAIVTDVGRGMRWNALGVQDERA